MKIRFRNYKQRPVAHKLSPRGAPVAQITAYLALLTY